MSYTYIDAVAHGFSAGTAITFSNLDGGTGIVTGQVYYVIASGLTANIFQFSATSGGSAFAFDTPITAGDVAAWPTYSTETGIMAPPTTPATPTGLALTSLVAMDADGHASVRLDITIDAATDAKTRSTWVTVQGPTGQPVIISFAPNETHASIPSVLAGIQYSATAVAYDVYGNASAATSAVVYTTVGDSTPPAQVTGLAAFGAILGLIATWNQSSALDLAHYEVQVDSANTFATATTYKIRANVLALQQIAAGTWYFRVRAVDLSGNAGTYSSTVSAVSRTVQTADLTDALITTAKLVAGSVTDVELASAAVTAAKIAVDAVTASAIAAGAVGTSEIAATAVTTAKLAAAAVTTTELAANAVTTAKIAADAVTASEIATGAVGSTELAAGAVNTAALAATAVTTAKIAADAVTAAEIAAGAVGSSELAAGAVIAGKITAGTIVAADIAAGTITGAKIAATTITAGNIAADTITANEIAASAITSSELAAGAVIAGKITAGTIVAADIAAGTITGAKIAATTITASNLVADTITANEIAAGAITASELGALSVTTAKLDAGAVTAAKITAATITSNEIAALTIVAANIAANTITAAQIAAGTITATEIAALTIVASNIAAGTITGAKIAANTITASNIAADTITANEIAASAITSSELAANAVVAGKIAAGTIATADLSASCSIQLVSNSGATVVINSSGITITNGKLTMQDENGASVLGSTGFSGAWSAFIALGVYNAQFGAGVAGPIAAGRTSALPYWTVAQPDGASGTLTYEAGPPADVKATWGAISKRWSLTSDKVPVNANRFYEFGTYVTVNAPTTVEVDVAIQLNWYKADGSASSITASVGPFASAFIGGLTSNSRLATGAAAPADAAFASIIFTAKEVTTHDAAAYCKFLLTWLTVTAQTFSDISAASVSVAGSVSGPTAIFGAAQVTGLFETDALNKHGGTSFPGSPATGNQFYRTDYHRWYYYDGTRWLSVEEFTDHVTPNEAAQPWSVTNAFRWGGWQGLTGVTDLWITSINSTYFVASGGTALDASNKWVTTYAGMLGALAGTSQTIASGASNVWRSGAVLVGALLGTTEVGLNFTTTKTGTPGTLRQITRINYRLVAV